MRFRSFIRFSRFLTASLILSLAGVSTFAQPSINSFSVPDSVKEMGVAFATVSASGQNPLTYTWSFEPDNTDQAFFFNPASAAYSKTISGTSVIFGVGNPGPNPPSPSLEGKHFTVKVSVSDGTDTVIRTRQVMVSGSNQRPVIMVANTGMGTQANPRVSPQGLSLTANQSFDPDGDPVRFGWRLGVVTGGQTCPGKVLVVFGKETDRPSLPLPAGHSPPPESDAHQLCISGDRWNVYSGRQCSRFRRRPERLHRGWILEWNFSGGPIRM